MEKIIKERRERRDRERSRLEILKNDELLNTFTPINSPTSQPISLFYSTPNIHNSPPSPPRSLVSSTMTTHNETPSNPQDEEWPRDVSRITNMQAEPNKRTWTGTHHRQKAIEAQIKKRDKCDIELKPLEDFFTVGAFNVRSIQVKQEDFVHTLQIEGTAIAAVTETWEDSPGLIDDLLEPINYTWHSRPRVSKNRGGGVGIAVDREFGSSRTLKVPNPLDLEVLWVIVTPRARPAKRIIAASFYASSSKNQKAPPGAYDAYITKTMEDLRKKYGNIHFIISGDRNNLKLPGLSGILDEHIKKPTRKQRKLDVVFSDLDPHGQSRTTCGLSPDSFIVKKGKRTKNKGVKADHDMAFIDLMLPASSGGWYSTRNRKANKTAVENFSEDLKRQTWRELDGLTDPNHVLGEMRRIEERLMDRHMPYKTQRMRVGDQVVMTGALALQLRKLRLIHSKEGRSKRFKEHERRFRDTKRKAKLAFATSKLEEAGKCPSKWFKTIN